LFYIFEETIKQLGEKKMAEEEKNNSQPKFKQWKISDMIRELRYCKKNFGDLPVEVASDVEGNNFARAGEVGGYSSVEVDADVPTKVIICSFD